MDLVTKKLPSAVYRLRGEMELYFGKIFLNRLQHPGGFGEENLVAVFVERDVAFAALEKFL